MKTIRSIIGVRKATQRFRRSNKKIGFVPTMGALHEGHLSLIRAARRENDAVVVSIFVNPTQFGPQEDFRRYPRTFLKDAALCRREGVDILFYPAVQLMYPSGFSTSVSVRGLSSRLCGEFRPGHFDGVATVVAKLFNIVCPDVAYFGQKDFQQALIIRRLVADLNFPLKIKVMPTVREKDGLALSSRNAYLNSRERRQARVLFDALVLAKKLIRSGERNPRRVRERMMRLIRSASGVRVEYCVVVDDKGLDPLRHIRKAALIALAVRIGKTRLIDNVKVEV